jgi:hypothetical protein
VPKRRQIACKLGAQALDSLADLGPLQPAGGGDYVEAELRRVTSGAEIDDEPARRKVETSARHLAAAGGDGRDGG